MKRELAQEIIDSWKADRMIGSVPGILEYAKKKGKYIPLRVRAQAIVGSMNKMASNALWAGNEKAALAYLVKYGLSENISVNRPRKENIAYLSSGRMTGLQKNPSADWKYVK